MIEFTVEDHTPELFQKLEAAVSRFITSSAEAIAASARDKMKGSRSGRFYGTHRASAPGESPASFSGRYIGSIAVINKSSLETKVGASVPYAPILENGMDRPLWGKTLTEILPVLETRLGAEIAGI
jgi:hypothetical protein